MEGFLAALGNEIEDVDQETFDVFSQSFSHMDLGMVDPKADFLEICIAGRECTIKQSPGILQSKREGGTTGAAVWQASVRVAEWLASPKNVLMKHGVLQPECTVLELGSGISGLVPCVLSPMVKQVFATDQQYLIKALRTNIETNAAAFRIDNAKHRGKNRSNHQNSGANVETLALDWEQDDIPSLMRGIGLENGVDIVVACDCIFNYSLIDPFVQTCISICKMRQQVEDDSISSPQQPTICLIAQQLRQPEVFERWVEAFMRSFKTWRVPNSMLIDELREGSGFVVHVGILR